VDDKRALGIGVRIVLYSRCHLGSRGSHGLLKVFGQGFPRAADGTGNRFRYVHLRDQVVCSIRNLRQRLDEPCLRGIGRRRCAFVVLPKLHDPLLDVSRQIAETMLAGRRYTKR
jgi:hypothetical protein